MSQLNIDIESLKKRKLMVATPMYGGQCFGSFHASCVGLSQLLGKYDVAIQFCHIMNESLVTRARNSCCQSFLDSDCTHMIFIDADIHFNPIDVLHMLSLIDHEDSECEFNVLCGPYPKKGISWNNINHAMQNKEISDEIQANTDLLSSYSGEFVFRVKSGTFHMNKPNEVYESGTGFMMFTKRQLEILKHKFPELGHVSDQSGTQFDTKPMTAFFDTIIDNKQAELQTQLPLFLSRNKEATHEEIQAFVFDQDNRIPTEYNDSTTYSKRYLSEDYMFCMNLRTVGQKIWLCPWIKLSHVGTHVYNGDFPRIAKSRWKKSS